MVHIEIWVWNYVTFLALFLDKTYSSSVNIHAKYFDLWYFWTSIHEAIKCFTAQSHKMLKPQDMDLEFSNRSEIWQVSWQQRFHHTCQLSEWYENFNTPFDVKKDIS